MSYAHLRPIETDYVPAKQKAKRHYGSHPYFTKRAWNVVQEYIKHFSREGDLVLDPFGGSGVTAVESLVLRRRAIYMDISEWACFLARNTAVAPIDLDQMDRSFARVEKGCRDYIQALYLKEESQLKKMRMKYWYPKDVGLPANADVSRVQDLFNKRMLLALSALLHYIRQEPDGLLRDQLLLAFSATLAKVNLTFLSAQNRKESRGGSSIFSIYRYKVAAKPVELNVWEQFELRYRRLLAAKAETNELIGGFFSEPATARFLKASATHLSNFVEPDSVDYIYTDPPYGGHIAYLDLSTMWNAWLGLSVSSTDRKNEIVVGGDAKKTQDDYSRLLRKSLVEMSKVLKKGCWLSLVFAHWDPRYWHLIVEACQDSGLEYVNTVAQSVGTVWSMHKKKNPLNVISGEWVLNFRKTGRSRPLKLSPASVEEIVSEVGEACIVNNLGATTEMLYTDVLPRLLEGGLLTRDNGATRDLRILLERFFVYVDDVQKWHLHLDVKPSARISLENRIRYCVAAALNGLRTGGESDLHKIHKIVRARLENGSAALTLQDVRSVLEILAHSSDGVQWRIPAKGRQLDLFGPAG